MAHESGTINIRSPHFAPMTKEDTAANPPVYATPIRIGEATTLTRTPTIQNVPAYADGIIVESFSGSPGGNVTLGLHALGVKEAQTMFGSRFDANGVLLTSSSDNPPYGALLFEAEKGNGKTRYMVLFKVRWNVPEMTLNTKTETVTWQQPTVSGTYQSRMDIYLDEKGNRINLTYVEYDEDHEGFNRAIADNWYQKVYEPVSPTGIPVTGISLDKQTLNLEVGGSGQLTAAVLPENATNKNVSWISANDAIATVTNGTVLGVSEGSVGITALTADGGKTASCNVVVVEA